MGGDLLERLWAMVMQQQQHTLRNEGSGRVSKMSKGYKTFSLKICTFLCLFVCNLVINITRGVGGFKWKILTRSAGNNCTSSECFCGKHKKHRKEQLVKQASCVFVWKSWKKKVLKIQVVPVCKREKWPDFYELSDNLLTKQIVTLAGAQGQNNRNRTSFPLSSTFISFCQKGWLIYSSFRVLVAHCSW